MREYLWRRAAATLRLGRALRLVWRCAPGWTAASHSLVLIQGVLPVPLLLLTKRIVDAVASGIAGNGGEAAWHGVVTALVLAGAVTLLQALVASIAALVGENQAQVVSDAVTGEVHKASASIDLQFFEDPDTHNALHRAQQEAAFRPVRIVNGLNQIGQNAVTLAGIAVLLATLDLWVAGVLFLAAAPGVVVRLVFSKRGYDLTRRRTEAERRAWYAHWVLTDAGHAKEVRLFALGDVFRRRFQELRTSLRLDRLRLGRQRTGADILAQAVGTVLVFGAYAAIAVRALAGAVTLGGFVMYFQAFQRGLTSLQSLLGAFAGLWEDNLFLGNFYEFLDIKPRVADSPNAQPLRLPLERGISVENVTFRYPGVERPALSQVSLEAPAGRVLALVGENGSGKTTLVKLLCRLYDPDEGAVQVDGTDIREIRVADLRRAFGVIFQDFVHYQASVRENVWFGNAAGPADDGPIRDALDRAGIGPVVERLPGGLDAGLGRWFQAGHELSIGEWQKVALARALFRDAPVVVLDEPTSGLDAIAEAEFFEAFRRIVAGRTAVVVSHRFSTVKMADRIVVLDEGRVVEQGTHDELLARGGTYARMFLAQAESYR